MFRNESMRLEVVRNSAARRANPGVLTIHKICYRRDNLDCVCQRWKLDYNTITAPCFSNDPRLLKNNTRMRATLRMQSKTTRIFFGSGTQNQLSTM